MWRKMLQLRSRGRVVRPLDQRPRGLADVSGRSSGQQRPDAPLLMQEIIHSLI